MKKKLFIITIIAILSLALCSCGQSPEEQYALIKEELKTTESLQASFFADYYDMKDLEKAKKEAEKVVDSSNEEMYKDVLVELQSQNEAFISFIETEKEKSFSSETGEGTYSFAVDESSVEYGFCFAPYVKQSSDYPVNPVFIEAETTDERPVFHFDMKNDVCVYSFELRNVGTRWIEVQDEEGNLQKAFVNTEIVLYDAPDGWMPNNELYPLGEGSCYLFNNEEYGLTLAIKDEVKGKGYILYYL